MTLFSRAYDFQCAAGEREALQELIGEADQRDVVTRLLGKIAGLQAAAAAAEATRRRLHNELVEVKGNVSGGCPWNFCVIA